jgi:hypothetical protein
MSSVLTHIDWNLIVAAMLLLSLALVFVVDVIAFTVFNAETETVMAIDLVILVLTAIFICVQIRTATDNFKNEDRVIAQNFTLSKSTVKAIDSFDTVTFTKLKDARYDNASSANEFRPLNDKITFTVLSVSNDKIILQDEHDKEIKLTKKSHPRVFSALQKLLK